MRSDAITTLSAYRADGTTCGWARLVVRTGKWLIRAGGRSHVAHNEMAARAILVGYGAAKVEPAAAATAPLIEE